MLCVILEQQLRLSSQESTSFHSITSPSSLSEFDEPILNYSDISMDNDDEIGTNFDSVLVEDGD